MSARLAQVEDRSWKRVARIRIYKGTLTQGWPVPPRAKKKFSTQPNIISYHIIIIYHSKMVFTGVDNTSPKSPRVLNSHAVATRGCILEF